MVLPSLLLILSETRLIGLLLRASTSTAPRFQQGGWQSCFATCDGLHDLSHLYRSDDGLIDLQLRACTEQPSLNFGVIRYGPVCDGAGAQEIDMCVIPHLRLYKFSESCTIAEIFLAPFSSSFILHLPVSSADVPRSSLS